MEIDPCCKGGKKKRPWAPRGAHELLVGGTQGALGRVSEARRKEELAYHRREKKHSTVNEQEMTYSSDERRSCGQSDERKTRKKLVEGGIGPIPFYISTKKKDGLVSH